MKPIIRIFAAALVAASFTAEAEAQINFAVGAHGLLPTGGFETDYGAGVGVMGMYPLRDDGLIHLTVETGFNYYGSYKIEAETAFAGFEQETSYTGIPILIGARFVHPDGRFFADGGFGLEHRRSGVEVVYNDGGGDSSTTHSDNGTSFRAGVGAMINERMAVRVAYTHGADEWHHFSFGVGYSFGE